MLRRCPQILALAMLALAGCNPVELPPIGSRLAGPVGLAVGCPGAPAGDCGGQQTYLYVTNSNNNLRYDSGSVMALDLSKVDVTNRVNFIGDVVADDASGSPVIRELLNFSGPIELTDASIGGGAPQPVALVTNRFTDEDATSGSDRVFFFDPDPAGAGIGALDVNPEKEGTQSAIRVGADPFGMVVDETTGRLYIANGTSGTVSVVSLIDECERQGEEAPPDAAPCVVDAVGEPAATDPELVPVDSGNPPDVLVSTVGVSSSLTPIDNWTMTFVEDETGAFCPDGNGFWRVQGEVSGPQSNKACTEESYASDQGEILLTIKLDEEVADPVLPQSGDVFTFETMAGDFVDFSPMRLAISNTGVSGRGVSQVALDPTRNWLYATSRVSSFVHILDLDTGLPEAVVPVATETGGIDSRGIVVSPSGDEVYVANRQPDSLLVISPGVIPVGDPGTSIVDEAVVDAIALGPRPADALLTADGSQVIVSCDGDGTVYAVDRVTRSVTAVAQAGSGAFTMTLSPDGSTLFVANYIDDSITVLNADPASPEFLRVLTTIQN